MYGDRCRGGYNAQSAQVYGNPAAVAPSPACGLLQVTNLANGRTVIVRVNDDRWVVAQGRVIELSRAAANELGFAPSRAVRVRVRYMVQLPDPPVLTADSGGPQRDPRYSAPIGASTTITTTRLGPLYGPTSTVLASQTRPARPGQPGGVYEVRAGTFANRANADRIAGGLTGPGYVQIQSDSQSGQPLWRVVVRGLSNAGDAEGVRSRAAQLGVWDARVIAVASGY